uniref:Uncharacterized protein n=1 Tax=Brassica oleracea TaxID=3712 RepID=A0A3P6E7M6_BRAOL|nr:unnamed protein product [Brassica oleracea]
MGRRKVEIKLIENKSSRQVTFSKRRTGLIEKARQLSVLCESSVAVLVVSASGKLYNSSSGDNSINDTNLSHSYTISMYNSILFPFHSLYKGRYCMTNIIDRYGIQHACELRSLDLAEKTRSYLPHNELLESVKSNLEESNVDNVSVDSLISLEDQLETALSATRARKTQLMMEFLKNLEEKEKLLREENQILASQLTKMEKKRLPETEGVRAMSSENSSGNSPPETLPLF